MPTSFRQSQVKQELSFFAIRRFQRCPDCVRGVWIEMTQVLVSKGVPKLAGFKNRPNRPNEAVWGQAVIVAMADSQNQAANTAPAALPRCHRAGRCRR